MTEQEHMDRADEWYIERMNTNQKHIDDFSLDKNNEASCVRLSGLTASLMAIHQAEELREIRRTLNRVIIHLEK